MTLNLWEVLPSAAGGGGGTAMWKFSKVSSIVIWHSQLSGELAFENVCNGCVCAATTAGPAAGEFAVSKAFCIRQRDISISRDTHSCHHSRPPPISVCPDIGGGREGWHEWYHGNWHVPLPIPLEYQITMSITTYSLSISIPRYSLSMSIPRYSLSMSIPRYSLSMSIPRYSLSMSITRYWDVPLPIPLEFHMGWLRLVGSLKW